MVSVTEQTYQVLYRETALLNQTGDVIEETWHCRGIFFGHGDWTSRNEALTGALGTMTKMIADSPTSTIVIKLNGKEICRWDGVIWFDAWDVR